MPISTFGRTIAAWLSHSATVARFATTDQGGGHYVEAPVVVGEALACRIRPAARGELARGEQLSVAVTDVGYAEGSADVERGDTWTVDGDTYRVTAVERPSIRTHYVKVWLERTGTARAAS